MINWAYKADATSSSRRYSHMVVRTALDGIYSDYCYRHFSNCNQYATNSEENPWLRIIWGYERSVWRIKLVSHNRDHLRRIYNIQIIVFGDSPNENRVVCTTLPSTGIAHNNYAAWCDHKIVGKGAELIFPPGIANNGELLQISVDEIQILGYG